MNFIADLKEKSKWVRRETLKLHGRAPETRIASSLSDVEIFVVLFYGDILKYNPRDRWWEGRDRLIISKGHGAISLYPILAERGFFPVKELETIAQQGSCLGVIPDTQTPGFETINGSLGHGLGVACGIATGLKLKKSSNKVFVLLGDGELNEGSVWEAIMYGAFHALDNLILILDNNKKSMLGYQSEILHPEPLVAKFEAFGWQTIRCDGHDLQTLHSGLIELTGEKVRRPKVLVADTVKGKGVPLLEQDPLSHVRTLNQTEILKAIGEI